MNDILNEFKKIKIFIYKKILKIMILKNKKFLRNYNIHKQL